MTLEEFIFSLNQDEDILVDVIDYLTDETVVSESWKSDLKTYTDYNNYKNWNVNYFTVCLSNSCVNTKLEIMISPD